MSRFFRYRAAAMQGVVEATRDVIDHRLMKGVEAESALAKMLAGLLPRKFDAGKGFLIDAAGNQSNELDLIIVDRDHVAQIFDFQAFELVPVEAASACVEVKTTLTKPLLDETFTRFQRIQKMNFFEERVTRMLSRGDSASLVASKTSRPVLVLFAYDGSISPSAVHDAYSAHPELATAMICILDKGIFADVESESEVVPPGLAWIEPVEQTTESFAGSVLALFLYHFLLPALFGQTKGTDFYRSYLGGQSLFKELN